MDLEGFSNNGKFIGVNTHDGGQKQRKRCQRCFFMHRGCIPLSDGSGCKNCQKAGIACSLASISSTRHLSLNTSTARFATVPSTTMNENSTPQQLFPQGHGPYTQSPNSAQNDSRSVGDISHVCYCRELMCTTAQNFLSICSDDSEEQMSKINPLPESKDHSQLLSAEISSFITKGEALIKNIKAAERDLRRQLHQWRLSRGLANKQLFAPAVGYCSGVRIPGFPDQLYSCQHVSDVLLRCTAYIFDTGCNTANNTQNPPIATWQEYKLVENLIDTFLHEGFSNTALFKGPFGRISAFHIALFNHDIDALNELWKRYGTSKHDTDFSGRGIAHVLVARNRWQILSELRRFYPGYIAEVDVDGRGMCLLAIAASLGNNDNFSLLRGAGAKSRVGRHLLDFAVLGGNVELVEQVVCSPSMVNQPYVKEVLKAIQKGRADIAERFFNRTDQTCQYNESDKQCLVYAAKRSGTNDMLRLSERLSNINVYTDGQQEAEADATKWRNEFATRNFQNSNSSSDRAQSSGQQKTYMKFGSGFSAFPIALPQVGRHSHGSEFSPKVVPRQPYRQDSPNRWKQQGQQNQQQASNAWGSNFTSGQSSSQPSHPGDWLDDDNAFPKLR